MTPSEDSEFFCILEIPKGLSGMRQYLRAMKLKGINLDWKVATENKEYLSG